MSEWNTMHLQTLFPQSITIGQQTSGGDGDERMINLPGNYILPFTGNGARNCHPNFTFSAVSPVGDAAAYPSLARLVPLCGACPVLRENMPLSIVRLGACANKKGR
jgi:hypothetical protein